jgi:hypothetical protein
MKYLILKTSLYKPEQLMEDGMDDRLHFKELYELQNLSCVEISETMFGVLHKEWEGKFKEIDKDQAEWGSCLFSELRDVAKVWEADPLSGYEDKTPIEVTPEIKEHVVKFMTTFALELIDDEYEKRFLSMRDATMLEVESWSIQKHEAKEWLTYGDAEGHETPFLDYLAEKEEKDKTELSKKILAKAESFQDKLSSMLVDMHKLKRKFKSASTIWDLNILYEDYLGVLMPSNQAVELERTVSEDDWTRKPEYEVNANEYNF